MCPGVFIWVSLAESLVLKARQIGTMTCAWPYRSRNRKMEVKTQFLRSLMEAKSGIATRLRIFGNFSSICATIQITHATSTYPAANTKSENWNPVSRDYYGLRQFQVSSVCKLNLWETVVIIHLLLLWFDKFFLVVIKDLLLLWLECKQTDVVVE